MKRAAGVLLGVVLLVTFAAAAGAAQPTPRTSASSQPAPRKPPPRGPRKVGLGPTTLVRLEKDSVTIRDTGTDTKGPAEYLLIESVQKPRPNLVLQVVGM